MLECQEAYYKRMHDLLNDLPDPPEHSNEIDDTVASYKCNIRVTGKNGLSTYEKRQKELLKVVGGDYFDNVLRACAKDNVKKRVSRK